MSKDFVQLHVHSHYSLLNALPSPKALVARAKEYGSTAMAITDNDAMYGIVPFYEECRKNDIKPIIGVDFHIAPEHRSLKRGMVDKKSWRLVVLAKNNAGYKNLLKLSSTGYLEGFYYTARIDNEILGELSEGLIGMSGGIGGEIPGLLLLGDRKKAQALAEMYQKLFGPGNFYLEIVCRPDSAEQVQVNTELIALSKETGIPLVATSNSVYLDPDDHEAWESLRCIQGGKTLEDYRRMSGIDIDLSMSHPDVIAKEFEAVGEALENTRKIADMCNVEIDLGNNYLPVFEMPPEKKDADYLRELCEIGLKKRYPVETKEIRDRFEFEFETISKMGFASYFLIVQDFLNFAREKKILVGPGRGSAAGSILSYALQITDIDPLEYDLLFERFLNPDRISMPDIDMDFADSRRAEVLDYVRNKYGADHVAGIITFGTMMPRAAVRDAARVLGLDFTESDRISKLVPLPVQGRHTPLEIAKVEHVELRNDYQSNQMTKRVVDLASKLEGTPRHTSQHACGIVISDKPLTHYVPIQESQHDDLDYVSQYSLGPVEAAGLVKMDFLGLSNLAIIESALEIIDAVHGDKIDVDSLELDDKLTFELLGRGETVGVFQLESEGMQRYLVDLKPTEFNDIVAMCALYRPGPLSAGMVPQYINRKNGREKVKYDDPKMEEILKDTYGVTIYQEQIMRISRELAGFTGGEADTLRKAMGKKKRDVLAKMKSQFISGCKGNGISEKVAKKIWVDWEGFADYAFNKSHSACYGMIAYRTAYLKSHYPPEYMAAVMNSDAGNIDRMTIEVQECTRMGIEVLPPDINESFKGFGVVPGKKQIRWGLVAIKNVGTEIALEIVRERKEGGPFADVSDFVKRINTKHFNRKSLESMVMAGTFDSMEERGTMMANVDQILRFNKQITSDALSNQGSLFALAPTMGVNDLKIVAAPESKRSDRLSWERELLGIYVSEHPYTVFIDVLKDHVMALKDVQTKEDKTPARVAGVITSIRAIVTKKGDPMAFVRIEDADTSVELVFFPRTYAQYKAELVDGRLMCLTGKVSVREGQPKSILVDSIACFDEDSVEQIATMLKDGMWVAEEVHKDAMKAKGDNAVPGKRIVIDLRGAPSQEQISGLRDIFRTKPGDHLVQFVVDSGGRKKYIKTQFSISPTNAVVDSIRDIIGGPHVQVVENTEIV
ncbi:DNA polymerase III subunit alpha [Candidatus Uhrbacteria bacterium]|jgi:DNA polymerase III subunit alpha|nr:DNA polymerase III subunit alpha [Candidatus Uhrbacteria bacterium]